MPERSLFLTLTAGLLAVSPVTATVAAVATPLPAPWGGLFALLPIAVPILLLLVVRELCPADRTARLWLGAALVMLVVAASGIGSISIGSHFRKSVPLATDPPLLAVDAEHQYHIGRAIERCGQTLTFFSPFAAWFFVSLGVFAGTRGYFYEGEPMPYRPTATVFQGIGLIGLLGVFPLALTTDEEGRGMGCLWLIPIGFGLLFSCTGLVSLALSLTWLAVSRHAQLAWLGHEPDDE